MEYYLSKSDFKLARNCRTKLYYKKHKYPSSKDYDEYLQMLAYGCFMIGKMAQLLFPEGVEIDTGTQEGDIELSDQMLKQEEVTLFEPAIYVNHQLIRVDVLVKRRQAFELIEVKSKSFSSEEKLEKESQGKNYFGSGLKSPPRFSTDLPKLAENKTGIFVILENSLRYSICLILIISLSEITKWYLLLKSRSKSLVSFMVILNFFRIAILSLTLPKSPFEIIPLLIFINSILMRLVIIL